MIEPITNYWVEFLTVAGMHALAVMSPGPDFAVVVKQSVSHGKTVGKFTAIGVGAAILIHIAYSLLGIGVLIKTSPGLFDLMKYAAAAYLLYLGISGLIAKPSDAEDLEKLVVQEKISNTTAFWPCFRKGFLTNGLNPKATLFFLTLFMVVIDPKTPLIIQFSYGLYMAVATALWFMVVASLFGHEKIRRKFERMGHWFDRIMGLALVALAVKIAMASLE
jgi:RhtB (resistance to homoserine/threonine) family protein